MIKNKTSKTMNNDTLEPLNKIKRIPAPGYLLTRIEGALEEVQLLIPKRLIFVYAAIFFVFLSLQIGVFSNSQNNTDIESYANSLGINSSITLYHD